MTTKAENFDDLKRRLEKGEATIGIVGLGYVGVPLALASCDAGFQVLGFDINEIRVADIRAGKQVIDYLAPDAISIAVQSGRFAATSDMSRFGEADAILICVPTPLTKNKEPNLSYISSTAEAIAASLRPRQIVVLESTTWPGTTKEVVQPILEATGLKCGEEFFLAFSPEREDPGFSERTTRLIPKVVGADDPKSMELVTTLYGKIVAQVTTVSGSATAEAVKLTENIFRAVNIALVNELKSVYAAMDVDIWEVIDGAATKPFGFMPFYPGPGLGGHCIPIDPFYLTWKARQSGVETRFVELAGEINTRMPKLVVDRLGEALGGGNGTALHGANILILGLAYKANVNDTRESPSFALIELIEERGAKCDYHDPHVLQVPKTREHAHLAGRKSVSLTGETIANYDAVLVATDHDDVDYSLIAKTAKLIVDTRNVFARKDLQGENVVKA